jgi:F0F1-type ATP synthase membrane subunit c/vacuolar-type H+-ATPase subunit K
MVSRGMRLTLPAVAVLTLLAAREARAQPSAADRETARAAMQEGRELRDKNDLKAALQRFKAADDIMHVPTTGLELARTQVASGLLVEARDTIAGIRKTPVQPNDPAPFQDARNKADELDASLEGRIPSLTIVVSGAAEGDTPAISVDGVSLPSSVAALPRKVDPGHHVVTARAASGHAKQEVDVAEGEKKEVQLTMSAGALADSDESTGPNQEQGPEKPQTTSHKPGTLTWAGIAVGGAGIIAGSVTGLMSMSKTSGLSNECPNKVCSTSQALSDQSSASSLGLISDIAFGVGLAGVGVAVVSLIVGHDASSSSAAPTQPSTEPPSTEPGASPAPESRLHVTPWIGLGSAGLYGTF